MTIYDRESFLVAYDQEQQTAIEIWSVDGTMFAETSWGELYTDDQANEVMKASIQADRITVRSIEECDHCGV